MPGLLKVLPDIGICRVKDADSNNGEAVSNFAISLLGTVQSDWDAPGFIAHMKRLPDGLERYITS